MTTHRPAVSSHSLGRAWVHSLPQKLIAAEKYKLDLEFFCMYIDRDIVDVCSDNISDEDLVHLAKHLHQNNGYDEADLIGAAHVARIMCDKCDIRILCLQPFMHYEGLRDRARHAARIVEIKEWIRLAKILGTDLISIPSSFLSESEISADLELIISDFREIADLGQPDGIRFSFEALCWGTYINTWEQAWQVVEAVDRSNFGICLDTFNMAGKMYADPESTTGKTERADMDVDNSLERLRKIPVEKVFFVQVVDAEKLMQPLTPQHSLYVAEQPSRMTWSRNCRLFYGESDRGAYLPIRKILETIVNDLGYRGPMSAEVFHACLTNPDARMPTLLAERARRSWQLMLRDLPVLSDVTSSARSSSHSNETAMLGARDDPNETSLGSATIPPQSSMLIQHQSEYESEYMSVLPALSSPLDTSNVERCTPSMTVSL